MRELARSVPTFAALPAEFHRLMRHWMMLGIPAFSAVLAIVFLMVTGLGAETSIAARAH